ncbi:hypothetical protein SAMN05216436_12732 [bacterium A37T11]|nr:hypothetical protein SAMN05216436_12732 [bacterium A37T11]
MESPAMETQSFQMSSYPKVAVVILNWNGRFFLEKFLPSVYNSTYPNLAIIIGDNGSTDDSVEFIKNLYPRIQWVLNGENFGFAGGYNRVLEQVKADYFVLLNSDVEVTPGWIEPVIQLLETNPTIAAAQPKVLNFYQRDTFEHAGAAGGFIDRYGFPFCRGRILNVLEKDEGQYNDSCEIFWATGAALFIRSSCWNSIKGFDSDFFAHMEEIDLCWRLKMQGHRIWYCGESVVYHVGGGTLQKENPFKTYLNFRNNLFMLQKNLPFLRAILIISIRLWIDLLAMIRFFAEGKRKDARAVSKAHVSFFRFFSKTASKRSNRGQESARLIGYYKGSIIWAFFASGKKTFSRLNTKKFK